MKVARFKLWLGVCAVILAGVAGALSAIYIPIGSLATLPPPAARTQGMEVSNVVGSTHSVEGLAVFPRTRALPSVDTNSSVVDANNRSQSDQNKARGVTSNTPSDKAGGASPPGAGMLTRELISPRDGQAFSVGRMWEAQARQPYAPSATPASAPDWRITGSVVRGSLTFVLVQIDGESEPQMLKIGSKLPGGATLVWVRPNVVGVRYDASPTMDLPVLEGQREQAIRASNNAASRAKQAAAPVR